MLYLILMLKGFLIGLAFIIPGVSGGTVAVYLGIYDKLVHAIGNIFKEFKQSLLFLAPIFAGIAISVVALAKLIGILLDWNSFVTLMLFIGLIIGGIPSLVKKTGKPIGWKEYVAFSLSFVLVLVILIGERSRAGSGIASFDVHWTDFLIIFFLGVIASMTMIVPGISGSALLMALGFYTAIVTNVIGNILDFSVIGYNIFVLVPFALGVGVGIILFSRVIEMFLSRYPKTTYASIVGFVIASVIVIFMEIRDPASAALFSDQAPIYEDVFTYLGNNLLYVFLGLLLAVIGGYATYRLTLLELKLDTLNQIEGDKTKDD
ncbi:MAG: DUF368 domain-containing protein [Bacilli bacterium]|nr:DUF368 domain-containing protein [Bacilli bacterium]MBN2696577.1 DUF368 domain-containing protein [Bacilli bacterium]